jgi:hypothetical protein
MEFLIPGIALALLHGASRQQNNVDESFANRSDLPNVDVADKNYPDQFHGTSPELDETSALSTVNRYENSGGAYTDKFFATNKEDLPKPGSNEQTYYSLTGEKVKGSYFEHNNMVPFFGSKIRSYNQSNPSESILDNYTGSGSQYVSKIEKSPLFSPNENIHWANGAPNMSEFYQSRVNPSMKMSNVKPFEEQRVGPGLGLGYTTNGSDGFNSGMMDRDAWLPKTADDLRVASKPKSSGHILYGHEGPALSAIKNIGTTDHIGAFEKNRPEQSFALDQRDFSKHNTNRGGNDDIGRLFITGGAEKGQTLHSIPVDRYVTRPETATAYTGVAASQNSATYVPGEYMPTHNQSLGAVPMGVMNANGRSNATDADYGIKSKKAYPNNRTVNHQDSYFGMVRSSVGSAVAPLLDILRPSRKENVVGNLRPYQNPGTTVPQSYIFNPADRMPTTIRETTENSKNHLNINANQRGGAYQVSEQSPTDTNRQETGNHMYIGTAGAGAGTREMKSYESGYNQRNNDIKSSTIQGYMVKGNMSMMNSDITMRQRTRDESLKNERAIMGTMPAQSPSMDNMGRLAGNDNSLYANIHMDRNTPDITNMLKSNPYVVNYKNGL